MEATSIIYRKLTSNEFKAITNTINYEGGGSQTYIDFPKGAISDKELAQFIGTEGIPVAKGFEWKFKVNSLSLGYTFQEVTIKARRDSSNALREQNKENRIQIWKTETSGFPASEYDEKNNPIIVYLLKDSNGDIWAGWFYRNNFKDNWFITKSLAPILYSDCGYLHFDMPIIFDVSNFEWPFKALSYGESKKKNEELNTLQIIYYGAPGTGKSHQTDELVKNDKENKFHQRTTFHPDSDYSSFVGCYKPSKEGKDLTYKFVAQAFLKAYTAAWKNLAQPYYLIIEEINRGNCAQIFGDIFQLLDRREDGFSKYHITTDTDIETYLRDEAFKDMTADDLPIIYDLNTEQIISGEIMQLPSNLHIYATMNTSDQSLFPIDSAFKRRWEWEYKPIEQPKDSLFRDWKIVTDDGVAYDWWNFLNAVNKHIFDTTNSEDKKMGYWFTKADTKKRITQKKFIGKVLFYLWNDVFKDYARTENTIFKVFTNSEKKDTEEYTFTDFFRSEGVTERIHRLMFTLGIEREEWIANEDLFPAPNGELDAQIMPENPKEIVAYWSDFKQKLLEGPMKDVIESYPIPNGPRFQTPLHNEVGLTNTYILTITKLKAENKDVTVCAGFNKTKVPEIKPFLYNHQEEINGKIQELTGVKPSWSENQYSITIYVVKNGIDMEWQVSNYQALYEYFVEFLKQFKASNEVAD